MLINLNSSKKYTIHLKPGNWRYDCSILNGEDISRRN